MKSLKQNILYVAIMYGLDAMCIAMRQLKKEKGDEANAGS